LKVCDLTTGLTKGHCSVKCGTDDTKCPSPAKCTNNVCVPSTGDGKQIFAQLWMIVACMMSYKLA
jgi:hypothetical protein